MGKKEKLFEKVKSGRRNVRPSDLKQLMKLWDFTPKKTKEGVFYTHRLLLMDIIRVVYHRESKEERKVKEVYVKQCIRAIERLSLLEEVFDDEEN